ncbi:L-threonylcarbamoyladenylate synthase [Aestuariispira insulae]|uniref:Threonylcarbamoyl-AMP synthase n=1 Tax=Aestuariispira insulae TaxID=1461337 RepID=A0A3D9HRW5_9PROT|nr:L-threonylcarbamoyladenylate synthase [Aestuariispira insulae]RED52232.1 translation factor SUA5 [Aestuariispira insulae]
MSMITPMDDKGIAAAAKALRAGELVAFPTETVYGLGADATNDHAVAGIYEAKGRPSFNPLIVHLPSAREVARYAEMTEIGHKLADRFWPGALTLVLPRLKKDRLSKLVSAGLDTVAVRVPAHGGARDLLRVADRPIAAPSANASGRLSPTEAAHVAASLGEKVTMILDGGPCKVGVESTIIDASGDRPTLLRPGGIAVEAIEDCLGVTLLRAASDDHAPKSPGMLSSHYAPGLPVRLNVTEPNAGEAWLGLGDCPSATLNLSPSGDLREAAANLFIMLHQLDNPRFSAIAIAPIPETGLGLAINDRIRRASYL